MGDRAISSQSAQRTLLRAAEIDRNRAENVPIQELRAAATEAGITADAFDLALAEEMQIQVRERRSARYRWLRRGLYTVVGVLVLIYTLSYLRPRKLIEVQDTPPSARR